MSIAKDAGFDSAVVDRDLHPVAWIQVKARPMGDEWPSWLRRELARRSFPPADFLVAADTSCIHLYRLSGKELGEPLAHFDAPTILGHYDPNFAGKRIFEPYLLTLVEAWFRDLAYHWMSPNPPGSEELKAVGFLERIEDGTTHRPGD